MFVIRQEQSQLKRKRIRVLQCRIHLTAFLGTQQMAIVIEKTFDRLH